jgi:hypothetical protein
LLIALFFQVLNLILSLLSQIILIMYPLSWKMEL